MKEQIQKAADEYADHSENLLRYSDYWEEYTDYEYVEKAFIAGANWADEHLQNHWHDAESDDLPPYDKEVIVLLGKYEPYYNVCFGHRPDPAGWDGKDLDTGEIKHYQAETYGKGGWNIYGVKWWLDVEFPKDVELTKMEEEEQ